MSDPCRLTSNKYYKTWGGSNFSRNAKSTPKLDYPKLTRIWTTPSLTKLGSPSWPKLELPQIDLNWVDPNCDHPMLSHIWITPRLSVT